MAIGCIYLKSEGDNSINGKSGAVRGVAYTGHVIFNNGVDTIIDVGNMLVNRKSIPLLIDHDYRAQSKIGSVAVSKKENSVLISGWINLDSPAANQIVSMMSIDPYQVSIGISFDKSDVHLSEKGEIVNGVTLESGVMVIGKSNLHEVSVVALGADEDTNILLARLEKMKARSEKMEKKKNITVEEEITEEEKAVEEEETTEKNGPAEEDVADKEDMTEDPAIDEEEEDVTDEEEEMKKEKNNVKALSSILKGNSKLAKRVEFIRLAFGSEEAMDFIIKGKDYLMLLQEKTLALAKENADMRGRLKVLAKMGVKMENSPKFTPKKNTDKTSLSLADRAKLSKRKYDEN